MAEDLFCPLLVAVTLGLGFLGGYFAGWWNGRRGR